MRLILQHVIQSNRIRRRHLKAAEPQRLFHRDNHDAQSKRSP